MDLGSAPADLRKFLIQLGIEKQYSMKGMAMDLAKLSEPIQESKDVKIKTVNILSELKIWANVV